MSNNEFMVATEVALALHLLALIVAIVKRRPKIIVRMVLIFAAAIVFLLAFTLRWAWPPLEPPFAVLGLLELAIGAVAITALLRGHRWAVIGVWVAFGLHTVLSALAVLFILTFKISRLM